eukprot:356177-Chlamydomonas_euryale.AAC.9
MANEAPGGAPAGGDPVDPVRLGLSETDCSCTTPTRLSGGCCNSWTSTWQPQSQSRVLGDSKSASSLGRTP